MDTSRRHRAFNTELPARVSRIAEILLTATLVLLSGITAWSGLTHGHDWGGDFACYIMQAASVVNGQIDVFMGENHFSVAESNVLIGPYAYPWGYPLLLAPVYAIAGLDVLALKSMNIVCYLLFLASLWWGFRKQHDGLARAILIGLFAFNPYLLAFLNQILSDIPFLTFSTLGVILIGRTTDPEHERIFPKGLPVLTGLVIGVATAIRSNGILLLVTLAASQMHVHRKEILRWLCARATRKPEPSHPVGRVRLAACLAGALPYLSFAVLTGLWHILLPDGQASHASLLKSITMESLNSNLHYYIDLPTMFFAVPHGRVLYGAAIVLATAGILARYESEAHIILYMGLTCLLFVVWPSQQFLRFLFPILPFFVSYALTGLGAASSRASTPIRLAERMARLAPAVILALVFARYSIAASSRNLANNRQSGEGPYALNSLEMFEAIETYTAPTSTVVFFKPRVMRLYTQRPSVLIDDPEFLPQEGYICIHRTFGPYFQLDTDELAALVGSGRLHPIYENANFTLYQLNSRPKGAPPALNGGTTSPRR